MYLSYNFIDKDPVVDQLRTIIEDEGVTHAFIEQRSGVTTQTLRNWFQGKTKRPQHATVMAVVRALGYDMVLARQPELASRQRGHRATVVPLHKIARPRRA